MEVAPPEYGFPFVPTSAWEANAFRAYGVEMCQDNGVAEVTFTASTAHQFDRKFTVTAEGQMTTNMDTSPELEHKEVRAIHNAR